MHIEHLKAVGFRNLDPLTVEPQSQLVLLIGDNGQGKTNILEALYLCATGRSFRYASPFEMIRHGAQHAAVHATFSHQGVRHVVSVHLAPRRRWVRVDDRALRQISHLLRLLNVVAFFPDDLRIAKGAPDDRRRFLDRSVANGSPEFVDAAVAYQKALRARNALLRAPQPPDRGLVAAYDDQLVAYGGVLHLCRRHALEALLPVAGTTFRSITRSDVSMDARLDEGLGLSEKDSVCIAGDFATAFRDRLLEAYPRDRHRGMTTVGPHRADLRLHIDGHDARTYGSQGQQRALVLALKLAEVDVLTTRLGCPPILLLDDVSSELDPERTAMLFQAVGASHAQTWVTSTGAARLPEPSDAQRLQIRSGRVLS